MPNAVLEYMAACRPIVATRVGGTAQVLSDSTGVLVNPDDPQALAQEIVRLLDDPHLARSLAENARSRVCETYRRDKVVHAFENLFEELARNHVCNRT